MSRAIDALLGQISDPNLRAEVAREVDSLRSNKDFGLVFERHLPENVRLYGQAIRRGCSAQELARTDGETWVVRKITDGVATLMGSEGGEIEKALEELVVVSEFGEPIYPGFEVVDTLERGGDKPFHAVINGENFHVLEALAYVYERQVDCIYIDPPYNTGARDWKYNNDYVDGEDSYRHSKWLSFMEKRLKVAKKLLNPEDSVLIVTIDEKEYLRLGLLLEQVFPNDRIQMISSLINPAAGAMSTSSSSLLGMHLPPEFAYRVIGSQQRAVPTREIFVGISCDAAALLGLDDRIHQDASTRSMWTPLFPRSWRLGRRCLPRPLHHR